jgi:ABC-type polysaccharide/polyol phosphate transport system ATPase subunit
VGDAAFRHSDRMPSCRPPYAPLLYALIKDGRTLLLVPHAGRLLGEVCQRCIYFEGGQVKYDGATSEAVRRYKEASATAR